MTGNVIPLTPRTQRAGRGPEPATTARPVDSQSSGEPAVYTVAEAAELLSLALSTAYALVRSGEIPARKLGGRWVIPRRRFHDWIDNLPEATPEDVEREFRNVGLLTDPAAEVRP